MNASSSLTLIFSLGLNYAHWSLTVSVSYMPLTTYASTTIKAADGTTLAMA
ncbi:hypothetical protein KM188_06745 [Mycetohabitans sp. B4]|nr:hypothetical protein [Mycetohabitans sp. B3]MCG1018460.1 hypothetical protein [Mycetohabitans sp. B4]MCG1039323.1 hypothetical protein [Mycetohabitans sp. B7]